MRIPLNAGGTREIAMIAGAGGIPAVCAWIGAATGHTLCWPIAVVLTLATLCGIAFFRDPNRKIPAEPGILVAPADGKVTETIKIDYDPWIDGPAMRLSIFLSVLDVHVNRSPCDGTVRSVSYKPGKFLDARDTNSGRLNEANTIVIEPDDPSIPLIVVRQIAGLIARRIVCSVKPGDRVQTGQRIGLIKFGSRTELIVAGHEAYAPAVEVGDVARGAATIMARRCESNGTATESLS